MDEALRIVLRHPAVASDPHVLYAAASSYKKWQPALQLGSFDVNVTLESSLAQLRKLASWLPKHAGSVSNLAVDVDESGFGEALNDEQRGQMLQKAEQLLVQALQPHQRQAALLAAVTEADEHMSAWTAAAADGLPAAAAVAPALRLSSFSSNCITSARVLHLLPANNLTRLELQIIPRDNVNASEGADDTINSSGRLEDNRCDIGWSAALARLSSLQHLQLVVRIAEGNARLDTAVLEPSTVKACLDGVAELSSLTSLELRCTDNSAWAESNASRDILQCALAQHRQLQRLQISMNYVNDAAVPTLDIRHLTKLSELKFGYFSAGTVLPRQLQHLSLDGCCRATIYSLASLTQLQQLHVNYMQCTISNLTSLTALSSLQSFRVEVWEDDQDALLRLAQLPLQNLALRYWNVPSVAAATAATWPKLPHLRELDLTMDDFVPRKQQLLSILAGLKACSSLTKLRLDGSYLALLDDHDDPAALDPEQLAILGMVAEAEDAAAGRVSVCCSLAGLTQLQHLTLMYEDPAYDHVKVPGDALALVALRGLTRLVLSGCGAVVDSLAATALALNLRQLRHLDLSACELGSMSCLAAVGQLKQLTELQLKGNQGVTQRALMQLTALRKLRKLGVDRNEEVTVEVVDKFWAAVPLDV